MKKLASLLTNKRLTDLCPPMTSTIGNPAFRNFVKSQKAYCSVDQYWKLRITGSRDNSQVFRFGDS